MKTTYLLPGKESTEMVARGPVVYKQWMEFIIDDKPPFNNIMAGDIFVFGLQKWRVEKLCERGGGLIMGEAVRFFTSTFNSFDKSVAFIPDDDERYNFDVGKLIPRNYVGMAMEQLNDYLYISSDGRYVAMVGDPDFILGKWEEIKAILAERYYKMERAWLNDRIIFTNTLLTQPAPDKPPFTLPPKTTPVEVVTCEERLIDLSELED